MKKFSNSIITLALAVLLGMLGTSCQPRKGSNGPTNGIAKVICEESFQNIMEQEIQVFEYLYPDANILPRYQSETAAFDSLFNKKVDLIITSTDLTKRQKDYLKAQGRAYRSQLIALDAVAIVVNSDNDINELSMSELKELFTGQSRQWGKLTPTKFKNDSIRLLFDGNAGGVIHYIKDTFLGGKDFSFPVYSAHSSEEVFEIVEKNRNAVGFIGVSWVSDDMGASKKSVAQRAQELNAENDTARLINFTNRVKVLRVRDDKTQVTGKLPYQAWINDGSYPLFRKIFAIDASPTGTLDHGFYAFLTGAIGQKIILQTGVMPAAEPVRTVEVR